VKLVREHINEKFVEDSDPVKDMGIGMYKWWLKQANIMGQKNEEQILKMYFPELPKSAPNYYPYILYDVLKDAGDGFPPQKSFFNNCRRNELSHGSGKLARKRIADVLKDFFEIDVNAEFTEEDLRTPLEEKFSVDSDPIKDLRIGSAKFFKSEVERFNHMFLGELEKELEIKKYKISNEDEETYVAVVFVDVLKGLSYHETVPNAFHDAYNTWKDYAAGADKPMIASSMAMNICKDILKNKYGVEWDSRKVFERFEEESDPIHDMNIGGFSYHKLSPGAIIFPKRYMRFGKGTGTLVSKGGNQVQRQYPLVVIDAKTSYSVKGEGKDMYITAVSLIHEERAREVRELLKRGQYDSKWNTKIKINIKEKAFNNRFEIIERGF
jgi:hypothetical protein